MAEKKGILGALARTFPKMGVLDKFRMNMAETQMQNALQAPERRARVEDVEPRALPILPTLLEPRPIKVPTAEDFQMLDQEQMQRLIWQDGVVDVTDEVGLTRDYWDRIYTGAPRVDELSIDQYSKMRRTDPQVWACFELMKAGILQGGGNFYFDGKNEADGEDMIDLLRYAFFDRLQGGMQKWLDQMMTAIWAGSAVSTKILTFDEEKGWWVYSKMTVIDPERITYFTDHFGNLIGILVSGISKLPGQRINWGAGGFIRIPPEKCTIWSINAEFGNWYGQSFFRRVYKWWKAKDFLSKEWMIYMERQAMPFRFVKPANASDLALANSIVAQIKQGRSAIAATQNIEIEQFETGGKVALFIESVTYCDKMIARGLGLPDGIFDGTTATPSGPVLGDRFTDMVEYYRQQLADVINKQLVRPLIHANFGKNIQEMPYWKWEPLYQIDASVIVQMIQTGVLDPREQFIRKMMGAPPIPKDFKTLEERNAESGIMNAQGQPAKVDAAAAPRPGKGNLDAEAGDKVQAGG